MFPFKNKPKANPVAEFEAAIRRAISIAQLAGVGTSEMAAVMSDWIVSWNRQALAQRERRNYATTGLHKIANIEP
jgi:hypothetical protein